MKLQQFDEFLTNGQALIDGGYTAIAIHPSSEVDLVDVGGYRLGVGAIVPVSKSSPSKLQAVRVAPDELTGEGDPLLARDVGQKLVVQLYEPCDQLIPPGPRLPVFRQRSFPAAGLGGNTGDASLVLRVPMQGRSQMTLTFRRDTDVEDLTVVPVGILYGDRTQGIQQGTRFVPDAAVTWWDGGGAAPTVGVSATYAAELASRVVHYGGGGDSREAFDEIAIFAYGGVGGDVYIAAEAFGERLQ